MLTTTMYVKEATSDGPIQNIQAILQQTEGIERAMIDVDDGEIKIEYHPEKISPQLITVLIEQNGLHVQTEK
ncbi:heavy-metal-associated domain-containing protein [Peribacillus psychrosaccharolyticus]|uniref:Heavy-metal-associated domain-containing protein n=1 Tax=Peribacillus psychrosaccharolyticus TaxID=1407 RepID=A0A974S2Y8_PERPY|nr:heavy-metal-associated domain-containing protein [Peribacillus psychrosaccharolyticus]MEC2057741.1 heavy-metal-associated domain-containing protein [Peribacillus psychrosaccharolyticus]MED3744729.1 heavy-metal-associated domain-containing protein [Peribacillus psychrosaccharolyticus]QQT02245.1 heavy-metal-associated domain-containing protein [Peribacillus psychrosaccharolyticus]